MPPDYLYLHGFASSPQSKKAQFLKTKFQAVEQSLHILDLNQGDFAHLTLSWQIQQGVDWVAGRDRVTILGSSFGGLTAAWIAQQPAVKGKIDRLVLLAPAFQFPNQWLPRLGSETVERWQRENWLSIYHYGAAQKLLLSYNFITDAQQYDDADLATPIPTLIPHGIHDEVIHIQASRDYAAQHPWVQLVELDSDHSLASAQDTIWEATRDFLRIECKGKE